MSKKELLELETERKRLMQQVEELKIAAIEMAEQTILPTAKQPEQPGDAKKNTAKRSKEPSSGSV